MMSAKVVVLIVLNLTQYFVATDVLLQNGPGSFRELKLAKKERQAGRQADRQTDRQKKKSYS